MCVCAWREGGRGWGTVLSCHWKGNTSAGNIRFKIRLFRHYAPIEAVVTVTMQLLQGDGNICYVPSMLVSEFLLMCVCGGGGGGGGGLDKLCVLF